MGLWLTCFRLGGRGGSDGSPAVHRGACAPRRTGERLYEANWQPLEGERCRAAPGREAADNFRRALDSRPSHGARSFESSRRRLVRLQGDAKRRTLADTLPFRRL